MRNRTIVVIAIAAACVFAAGGVAIATLTTPSGSHADGPGMSPTPQSSESSDAPTTGGDGGPDTTTPPSGDPTTPPDDGAAPPADDGGPGAGTPVTTLPPAKERPRILADWKLREGTATGKLVAGFPDTIPTAPHSDVDVSSLTSEGARVQATFTATSSQASTDILAFYRAQFAKFGLLDAPAPAVGGSTAVAFTRDDDSITLSLTPVDGGVEYVIFGALTAHG